MNILELSEQEIVRRGSLDEMRRLGKRKINYTMAEKDQNNQPIALEEVEKDNKELKEKVTLGQKYLVWLMIAVSAIAIIVIIYIFAVRNPG